MKAREAVGLIKQARLLGIGIAQVPRPVVTVRVAGIVTSDYVTALIQMLKATGHANMFRARIGRIYEP